MNSIHASEEKKLSVPTRRTNRRDLPVSIALAQAEERVLDATVIERSWTDPESFAVIFDRHAPAIHRYVGRRLGQALADDVVAETFLTAFRRRKQYDVTRADALPWLYGIASKLVARHRAAELRFYRLLQRTATHDVADSHEDQTDARVVAQAAQAALASSLARLNRRDRDVLLLVAWADLSYEAVAETLGVPVGTVRSRLNRARRIVRLALGTNPASTLEEN